MSSDERERAAFEAWAVDEMWEIERTPDLVAYESFATEVAWQGWLARSAIPTVVSEEMVEAGARGICFGMMLGGDLASEATRMYLDHNWPKYIGLARACLTAALTISSEAKDG